MVNTASPASKHTGLKLTLLISTLFFMTACDIFLSPVDVPAPVKSDPGATASLPSDFATEPTGNTQRITSAQKQNQSCTTLSCTQSDAGHIAYSYHADGRLDEATEFNTNASGTVLSQRKYYYSATDVNRLDKVAVRGSNSGNYTALHDYYYDNEDDVSPAYTASTTITRPKLRREYICEVNVSDPTNETCTRITAKAAIRYVYFASGHLYHKDFDSDNDNKVEHQFVYQYDSANRLTQVDTDNFYNGVIDERSLYERDSNGSLTKVLIDNDFLYDDQRGIKIAVSYEQQAAADPNSAMECYFNASDASSCTSGNGSDIKPSQQNYHWKLAWTNGPCWAGGLDDIDPQSKAINYLCK